MKERKKRFLALIIYILCVLTISNVLLPKIINAIFSITIIFISISYFFYILLDYTNKIDIIKIEIEKLKKEIIAFLPILFTNTIINSFIMKIEPIQHLSIGQNYSYASIFSFFLIVVIKDPIQEEFIFRLLPNIFIKNEFLYITISAFVFAGIHVINSSNHSLYYINSYLLISLYLADRYYQTKDILVTISLHIFNNLLATFFLLLKLF